jgi:hypothetical protein
MPRIARIRAAPRRAGARPAQEEREGAAVRVGRPTTLIPPAGSGEYRIDILREQRERAARDPSPPDEYVKTPSTVPVPRNRPAQAPSAIEIASSKSTVPVPESTTEPAPSGVATTTAGEHEDVFVEGINVVFEP